ncbi:MAG TPA: sigma-70 family RNA polymerase sigma factor [Solirubrobacteraceae bacterium]
MIAQSRHEHPQASASLVDPAAAAKLDDDSRRWLERLRPGAEQREQAVRDLHALLLKAARFEVARRRSQLVDGSAREQNDLAQQSADDALMAVLAKLDRFRGDSRFTTWAYKFALLEAGVAVRKHAWRAREVQLAPDAWQALGDRMSTPGDDAEMHELIAALQRAVGDELSPRQREVLLAVTVGDVPIDVLAERLGATRGALYKTIHDARRKLRTALSSEGFDVGAPLAVGERP